MHVATATGHPDPFARKLATVSEDYVMIELTRELVHFMSQDPLSVEDVINRVGVDTCGGQT